MRPEQSIDETVHSFIRGKRISYVKGKKNRLTLKFKGVKETLSMIASGDCCNITWFEYFEKLNSMIGKEIRGFSMGSVDDNVKLKKYKAKDSVVDTMIIIEMMMIVGTASPSATILTDTIPVILEFRLIEYV